MEKEGEGDDANRKAVFTPHLKVSNVRNVYLQMRRNCIFRQQKLSFFFVPATKLYQEICIVLNS